MIISKIQGGLGNQLFQWAIAENLANLSNTNYSFDISFYLNQNHRKFELYKFKNIPINISQIQNIDMSTLNIINESSVPFNEIYYKNPTYLYGYWQNEIFFRKSKDLIKSKLKIDNDIDIYIKNKYPILNENTVSIHIRRTDYLSLSDYHYNQSLNYYNDAYDILNDKNINVIVFSDDINWCKENMKFNNIHYIEGEDNIIDLYIMSKCKNNIIANSTFSWWAAWLNENTEKKVFAPKNWFGEKGPEKTNLLLDEWIIIDNN
jgi:hypothetical protein